jgi:hypothetical protein
MSTDEYTTIDLGEEEDPEARASRRLNPAEQLQVAVWVVEGLTGPRIQDLMVAAGMPSVTQAAISRYRHNDKLLEKAKEYLRQQLTTVGLAEKAVRIRKLQGIFRKLEGIAEDTGFLSTTVRTTGFDRTTREPMTSTETKFDAPLVKEMRDTLEQIRKEVEPLEKVIVGEQTNNYFMMLGDEDKAQITAALGWVPAIQPRLVEGQFAEAMLVERVPEAAQKAEAREV